MSNPNQIVTVVVGPEHMEMLESLQDVLDRKPNRPSMIPTQLIRDEDLPLTEPQRLNLENILYFVHANRNLLWTVLHRCQWVSPVSAWLSCLKLLTEMNRKLQEQECNGSKIDRPVEVVFLEASKVDPVQCCKTLPFSPEEIQACQQEDWPASPLRDPSELLIARLVREVNALDTSTLKIPVVPDLDAIVANFLRLVPEADLHNRNLCLFGDVLFKSMAMLHYTHDVPSDDESQEQLRILFAKTIYESMITVSADLPRYLKEVEINQ